MKVYITLKYDYIDGRVRGGGFLGIFILVPSISFFPAEWVWKGGGKYGGGETIMRALLRAMEG